ncbi:MAG: hypothetical protein FD144_4785 [Rhodospirillaceae bacterium]|nr:MAG: hypothetical protein FD144_4785 [Rhodospirillaceae bacterium]
MSTDLVASPYGQSLLGRDFATAIPEPVRTALVVDYDLRFDGGQFSHAQVRSIRFRRQLLRSELIEAARAVELTLRPGGVAANLRAMKKLRAVARQRDVATDEANFATATYGEQIAQYPTDVVAEVCERWMRTSPFWPALSELIAAIETALAPKRAVLSAIRSAIANPDEVPPAPETLEQRLITLVRVCRKHGREESAAKAEMDLAKLQGRPPELWALAAQSKKASPATATWAGNDRLLDLAAEARNRLLEGHRA